MERTNGRITLKMIAEKANTSIGTVDRAINNRSGISPRRREEVLAIAKEMGYRPNLVASALGRKKTLRIAIAYPVQMQDFYKVVDDGVDAAAAELVDYGVVVDKVRYETQDPEVAYERLKDINPEDYDGIAINSSGGRVAEQIDRFIAAGTPVITFNSDSPNSRRLFYVGSDGREAGMLAAELMALLLRGRGNVAVMGNFARATPFMERFSGFCDMLQPAYPDIHLYPCAECQGESALAARSLLDLLAIRPDLDGVFCTGYTSTAGGIEALKQLNRRDIPLIGFDISKATGTALREGWCTALIFQDPYQQGYRAVKLLAKHLLEEWLPERPRQLMENRLVLKSNIDNYSDPAIFRLPPLQL